jgi:hypothetical protein
LYQEYANDDIEEDEVEENGERGADHEESYEDLRSSFITEVQEEAASLRERLL